MKQTELEKLIEKKLGGNYTPLTYANVLKGWKQIIKPLLLERIKDPQSKEIIKNLN
jgi:hypothetical protein